jgi:hypothetical protein
MAPTLPVTTDPPRPPRHTSDPVPDQTPDPRPILKMSTPMSAPLRIRTSGLRWIRTSNIESSSRSCPRNPVRSLVTLVSMRTAVLSPPSLAVIHHLPAPQFMSLCLLTAYCTPTAHVSHRLGCWTCTLMVFPSHHSFRFPSRSLAIPFGLSYVAPPATVPTCDTGITAVPSWLDAIHVFSLAQRVLDPHC